MANETVKTTTTRSGISLSTLLFLIFLVLKLTKFIDWAWIWVFSPLWIPVSLVILGLIVLLIISLFMEIHRKKKINTFWKKQEEREKKSR